MKILVVDDSVTSRLQVKGILINHGSHSHEIFEASNGHEALVVLSENPDIKLVFLDINMPELSGIGVLEKMRTDPRLAKIAVIMLTTENTIEKASKAEQFGVHGFVVKPPSEEVLFKAVELINSG